MKIEAQYLLVRIIATRQETVIACQDEDTYLQVRDHFSAPNAITLDITEDGCKSLLGLVGGVAVGVYLSDLDNIFQNDERRAEALHNYIMFTQQHLGETLIHEPVGLLSSAVKVLQPTIILPARL